MNIEMLWFDNSHMALAAKIRRGADHYEAKLGVRPERVTVHPSTLLAAGVFENRTGVRVETSWRVEPCFFAFTASAPEPQAPVPGGQAA